MVSETGGRDTFDRAASRYQSARPAYPVELFDDLVSLTGVVPPAQLLEIGAGPGTATVEMARRGFRITVVELGARLADQARLNLADYPNVSVVTSAFETWRPAADTRFDLAYAANSWHWLDRGTRWEQTAQALTANGHLAIFGASHAFPEGFDPIFTDIQALYREIGESIGDWPPPPPRLDRTLADEAEASGLFRVVGQRMHVWAQRYDADSYLDLLNTFANHIAMAAAHRDHLYAEIRSRLADRPDGQLTRHWVARLVVLQRH